MLAWHIFLACLVGYVVCRGLLYSLPSERRVAVEATAAIILEWTLAFFVILGFCALIVSLWDAAPTRG